MDQISTSELGRRIGALELGRIAAVHDDGALEGTASAAGPTINRIATRCYAPAIDDAALEDAAGCATLNPTSGPPMCVLRTFTPGCFGIDDGMLESTATAVAAGPTQLRLQTTCVINT